jgi:hypothetical protein
LVPLALAALVTLAACGGGDDEQSSAVPGPETGPTYSFTAIPDPSSSASPTASVSASGTPTATGSPTATASATPTGHPLALAKRWAAAGVLRASDLADWDSARQTLDAHNDEIQLATKDCLDRPLTAYQARDPGRSFKKDGVEVTSKAEVTATPEQSISDLEAMRSSSGARCFRKALLEVAPEDVELSVKAVPVTVDGADQAVAYRISYTVEDDDGFSGGGYQIIALVGSTQIWLDTSEGSEEPTFSLDRLAGLAERLVARVQAAGGN